MDDFAGTPAFTSSPTYRYHALFGEFLRRQLAREHMGQLGEYHRRAAEAQPIPSQAITHYCYSAMSVEPTDDGQSMVRWDMDFRAKYGPFGWLMGQTMMKRMMGKIIDGNLNGLSDKVRSNRTRAVPAA